MTKINLEIKPEVLKHNVDRARERGIIYPTFSQQKNPELVPENIKSRLSSIGLWDVHPLNMFRVSWKNEPVAHGGGYGPVNFIELPSALTGVDARIVALVGKWFPTGAHKVGASSACLVPRLVTGQFDAAEEKAVWPSTGNYCRGGSYISSLLGCESIAILPEGMSKERFAWLKTVAGEIIATPGTESNVKEIYDKCAELRQSNEPLVIFNQFDEFGNYLWHYDVTGHAMEEVIRTLMQPGDRFAGLALTTGSAGTIASGDYLKQVFPTSKIVASEALQCPTLLENGFGAHRIEGIGDKHIPWIHNVRNTDFVTAIDDTAVTQLSRLFNEESGQEFLYKHGLPEQTVLNLPLMGFSGIANMLSAIKFAKYYELDSHDIVMTVLTDSMQLYGSRIEEYREEYGKFDDARAASVYSRYLMGERTDNLLELSFVEKRRIHNLKYYTWVEQQGKTFEEIRAQWYDPDYWTEIQGQLPEIEKLIVDFNAMVSA